MFSLFFIWANKLSQRWSNLPRSQSGRTENLNSILESTVSYHYATLPTQEMQYLPTKLQWKESNFQVLWCLDLMDDFNHHILYDYRWFNWVNGFFYSLTGMIVIIYYLPFFEKFTRKYPEIKQAIRNRHAVEYTHIHLWKFFRVGIQ